MTSPGVGSDQRAARRSRGGRPERRRRPRPPRQSAAERPEVLVGAAFAGAFLLARLIRAATSSDD